MIGKLILRVGMIALLLGVASACAPSAAPTAVAVPALPFDDNPDPAQCGIPIQWGKNNQAWLNGVYEGELVQPTVFLYDSHLRKEVTGAVPSGTKVEILLYQQNPVLDFYLVKTTGENVQQGWVPAPFLRFEPVSSN